jgi:hypothetical protein
MPYPALNFAAVAQPLFGNVWLALLAVLAGIAVFLAVVAGFGRLLAATHPDAPPAAAGVEAEEEPDDEMLAPDVVAVIAAAVTASCGARVRIASVRLAHGPAPTVEALMQQWSLEGRRQIYGSHKVR